MKLPEKEFEDIIKDLEEKQKHYKEKMNSLKLERAKFIEKCFLGKTYQELMRDGITLDRTGRLDQFFIFYIRQKENLEDHIIIRKRFKRDLKENHPKIILLRRLVFDSISGDLLLRDNEYSSDKEPIVELLSETWQQVKEVLSLIKKYIQEYIIRHHQIELDKLIEEFGVLNECDNKNTKKEE